MFYNNIIGAFNRSLLKLLGSKLEKVPLQKLQEYILVLMLFNLLKPLHISQASLLFLGEKMRLENLPLQKLQEYILMLISEDLEK